MTNNSFHTQWPAPPRTQWSLVFAGQVAAEPLRQALAGLLRRYAYPAYAFLRASGADPALATRIIEAMADELQRSELPRAPPNQFRTHLMQELRRKLAQPAPALAADLAAADELENRYRLDPGPADSPDQAFQRAFALEVIERARARLRREAIQSGREALFDQLLPFLDEDPSPGVLETMQGAAGIPHAALEDALRRLRQRFRELVDSELGDLVASPQDVGRERRALLEVLAGRV